MCVTTNYILLDVSIIFCRRYNCLRRLKVTKLLRPCG